MNRTKDYLFQAAPNGKVNITTKERKELLVNETCDFIWHGNLYDIKFKSLGGGVWQAYSEIRNSKSK